MTVVGRNPNPGSASSILGWAKRFVGAYAMDGQCMAFVNRMYGGNGGSANPTAAWNAARSNGTAHSGPPPIGAAVVWKGGSTGVGHTAIVSRYVNGVPYVISTGIGGRIKEVPMTHFRRLPYQGWLSAVNGVKATGWTVPKGAKLPVAEHGGGSSKNVSQGNGQTTVTGPRTGGGFDTGSKAGMYAAYLMKRGLSSSGAAAVVANLMTESGLNPYSSGNDRGATSRGLAQWRAGRGIALQNWATAHNKPWTDWKVQLDFLTMELQRDYPSLAKALAGKGDAQSLAVMFMQKFERPLDHATGGPNAVNRAKNARAVLKLYKPGKVSNTPSPDTGDYTVPTQDGYSGGGNSTTTTTTTSPAYSGGSGGIGLGSGMPKDKAGAAAWFGYSLDFFNSVPELKKLFDQGYKQGWTSDRFAAAVRSSKWYKTNSESLRNLLVLQQTDPESYKQKVAAQVSQLKAQAVEMGSLITDEQANALAFRMMSEGWSDSDPRVASALAGYVNTTGQQNLIGAIGDTETQLRAWANDNGIRMNPSWFADAAKNIVAGTQPMNYYTDQITESAKSAFPGMAKLLTPQDGKGGGTSLRAAAGAYIGSMAQNLEMDESQISFDDPTLRSALTARNPETGQAAIPSLYDFEKQVRKDPRWRTTLNATNTVTGVLSTIGSMFGKGD